MRRLIDADALANSINARMTLHLFDGENSVGAGLLLAQEIVSKAPTVEQNKGKWTENSAGRLICNQCGHYAQSILSNFCPFCGADMRGDEE